MTTEDKNSKDSKDIKDTKDSKEAKLGNLGAALEQAVQSKVAQENEPKPEAVVEQPTAAAVAVEVVEEVKPKIDALGRSYATGRRKDASARVWIKPGKGEIKINGRPLENYFARGRLQMVARQPFEVAGRAGQFDVMATASGGGLSGQAGALMHGISRALVLREPELRPTLKKEGLLTRDSRAVERKKYGRRKARRSFQFSKR